MAAISKDTYSASDNYRKVIFEATKPLNDFDLNELQDILYYETKQLAKQLVEGGTLLGSSGFVVPAASAQARRVDVGSGYAVHNGSLISIPATTNLQVFNDATTTGTASSCVYVEWWTREVDATEDTSLADANVGAGSVRTKLEVQVLVNIGSTALPTITPGHYAFKLAVVTHNFDANGTVILATDIVMESAAPTPGELAGNGAARTLSLLSAAPAAREGFILNTKAARSAGVRLFDIQDNGVSRLKYVDGKLTITGDVDITGNLVVTGNLSAGGAGTLDATHLGGHAAATYPRLAVANTFTLGQKVTRAASSDSTVEVSVTGDTVSRLTLRADGKMEWGAGNAAADTFLYRTAANSLRTDGAFTATGSLSTNGSISGGNLLSTGYAELTGIAAPATPTTGKVRVFYNTSTSKMQFVDDSGTLRDMGGADTSQALTWTALQTFDAGILVGGTGDLTLNNGKYLQIKNSGGTAQNIVGLDASGYATFPRTVYTTGAFISNVATGTQPVQVQSTTKNTNLNADLLDGKHDFDFERFAARVAGMVYRMITDRLHLNGVAGVY